MEEKMNAFLIIEDDLSLSRLLQAILKSIFDEKSISVLVAPNIEKAETYLKTYFPNLIFMDGELGIKKLNTLGLVRLSKQLHPKTPIIATSGKHDQKLVEAGCDASLPKPFLIDDIQKLINKLLS